LILAIDERDRQVAAFREVDKTLKKELRKAWQKQIDEWREDKSKPNPYADSKSGECLDSLSVWRHDTDWNMELRWSHGSGDPAVAGQRRGSGGSERRGKAAWVQYHVISNSRFAVRRVPVGGRYILLTSTDLISGVFRQRIREEVKGRTLLAADQSEKLAEMRLAFYSKLAKFRKLQAVYMPGAVQELEEEEDTWDSELPPPKAEDVKLYLPSGLRTAQREEGCRKGLPVMEAKLREGQCWDALVKLRSRLHAKRHLLDHREGGGVAGQRAVTRSQTLIGRIGDHVDAAASKYRRARLALIALRGEDAAATFRDLLPADVTLDEEREIDARVRKKLGNIGSSKFRRQGAALSSKEKHFSWIWTDRGGPGKNEEELHDCKCAFVGGSWRIDGIYSCAGRMVEGEGAENTLGGGGGATPRGDEACPSVSEMACIVVGDTASYEA
jgi:hypothetical protein